MNWLHVKLILAREIRDQLRDRRTLFMIVVLPILLYPLLGMSFFQISQFMREQSTSVWIIGAKGLEGREELPPLWERQRFAARLFGDPDEKQSTDSDNGPSTDSGGSRLLELHFAPDEPPPGSKELPDQRLEAERAVQAGQYDVAVYFPPDFADRLQAYRQSIVDHTDGAIPLQVPSPQIIYSTANEKSQIAFVRVSNVLERWREEIGRKNLSAGGVPADAARPFEPAATDVADQTGHHGAAMWSKILPVLLLLWALTGAFYPAVDLCAGEKERGTLETLLSSPAERSEIVLGKLLTIMIFSMATAVLNLISMAVTGWLVLSKLPEFGLPPATAAVWLAIALVPVSALFSALCLALAAFARSTKEGQYYLMPLLLVTMPLVILPMAPGVELNLGNSLIPVTGVVLLLRSALEGTFWQHWQFSLPVVAITLGGCLLSIRWAVDQFNSESVLFRESERLDVGLWLRHLLEDRQPTPTVAGAVFCGVMILMIHFSLNLAAPQMEDLRALTFRRFAMLTTVTQLVAILTPAMLMAVMLTSSPRQTLLLRRGAWLALPLAACLALVLHPVSRALQLGVTLLYPPSEASLGMLQTLQEMITRAPLWQVVLVIAVVPAFCEELAFRGFILSGFRHMGHKWRAIFYSALLFGLTHVILQQQLLACLLGVLIGYLAVQSGSIWPGVVFHLVHNTMAVALTRITPELSARSPLLRYLAGSTHGDGMPYHWMVIVASGLSALVLLAWFHRLPYWKSAEEQQQEAIARALQEPATDEDM